MLLTTKEAILSSRDIEVVMGATELRIYANDLVAEKEAVSEYNLYES